MSFIDSLKSRLQRSDDEENFRRGLIDGRYPEGVDDFEPLSTTGNFIAPQEVRDSYASDDPLLVQGKGAMRRSSGNFGTADQEPIDVEEDVQVFERVQGQRRATIPREAPKPFRERFQERVAAANVSGMQDENLGRSRFATGELRTSSTSSRGESEDDGYERESDGWRRTSQSVRAERDFRQERRTADQSQQSTDARARLRSDAVLSSSAATSAANAFATEAPSSVSTSASSPVTSRASSPVSATEDQLSFAALPTKPEVVRVRTYDDVSTIARAVMNNHRPVVLPMRGTAPDLARRVLDFSFGLSCGSGATMEELGDRVYCVLPRGTKLSDRELAALRHQGILGN